MILILILKRILISTKTLQSDTKFGGDIYTQFRCLTVYKQVVLLFNTPRKWLKSFCYIPSIHYMFD